MKYEKLLNELSNSVKYTLKKPTLYNEQEWLEPLKEYKVSLNLREQPDSFQYFMSLNSKIYFEYSSVDLFTSQYFEALKSGLNLDQVRLLMYSKNPQSRVFAIKYFIKYQDQFEDFDQIIEWMRELIKNHPKVACGYDLISSCPIIMVINQTKILD